MEKIDTRYKEIYYFLQKSTGIAKEHVEETMIFKHQINRKAEINPPSVVHWEKESKQPSVLDVSYFLASNRQGNLEGNYMKLTTPRVEEHKAPDLFPRTGALGLPVW